MTIRGGHKTDKLKKLIERLPKFRFGLVPFGFSFQFLKTENILFGFDGMFECTESAKTEPNHIIIYNINFMNIWVSHTYLTFSFFFFKRPLGLSFSFFSYDSAFSLFDRIIQPFQCFHFIIRLSNYN